MGGLGRVLGGVLEGLGGVLGRVLEGSWGPKTERKVGPGTDAEKKRDLGRKMAGFWFQHGRILGFKAEPKSTNIVSKMDPYIDPLINQFFCQFLDPKIVKKPTQN